MKIGFIIQARMSSQRFPGKMMHALSGKPLIQYLTERLERCPIPHETVLTTSTDSEDKALEDFCREKGLPCVRGSLENVAERFKNVLDQHPFDFFVRINGDSPLLDPYLIEKGVHLYEKEEADLITNVHPRSYPRGQSVEVVRTQTFLKTFPSLQSKPDQEHVTRYFYEHSKKFKILNFSSDNNQGQERLCVDTQDDMNQLSDIINHMDKPHWTYSWESLLKLKNEIN